MLVVKKPFKSLGTMYLAGSVITEPANIKRLRGKIAEGKIVEVTEQTYESTAKYFKAKYGVDIPVMHEASEEHVPTEESSVNEDASEKEPKKVSVVKASVVK